jgi:hypothetical protein
MLTFLDEVPPANVDGVGPRPDSGLTAEDIS